jgi:hypothetical protein
MSKSCLITELNTNALIHAITVMKMFHDQINLHQAMMTLIMVILGVVVAYTIFVNQHPGVRNQTRQWHILL